MVTRTRRSAKPEEPATRLVYALAMEQLGCRDLAVSVGGKQVCKDFRLDLSQGECWAMLGANGVGKTTLLHTLAGLRSPAAGQVLFGGRPLDNLSRRQRARHVGVLFQDSDDPFPATVLQTALSGRHPHLGAWGWERPEDVARTRRALERVGLSGLERRWVPTLSGGERRRLAVATLLTQDPVVMLLDEPNNHLDLGQQIAILGLLTDRARRRGGVSLMVLHDVNLALRFCDRILMLFGNGETLQGATGDVGTEENFSRLFGYPVGAVGGPNGPVMIPL